MELDLISGGDPGASRVSINQGKGLILKSSINTNASVFNYIKEGSAISSVTILLASSIGSTIIIVPNSILELGLYLGLVLLLVALFINYFASYCLILISHRTGRITYKGLGDELFGSKYGAAFEVLMILACYIRMILYLIHLGKIFAFGFKDGVESQSWFWYIFVMMVIFPISLMRNITKLRYIVILTILGAGIYFLTIISDTIYIISSKNDSKNDSLFTKNPFEADPYTILRYFGQFLISFSCQPNVLSVYEEISFKTARKGIKYVLCSYIILSCMYVILGIIRSLVLFDQDESFYKIIGSYNSLGPLVLCI
jgi:amino acid permease